MLVANSIVLAVTGFAVGSDKLSNVFKAGLPVVGIVLCVLWLHLTKRGFDNYVYWILSARELEEKYLPAGLTTISRGGLFADGKSVDLTIGGRDLKVRMSRVSRIFKAAWSSYLVIASFLVLYLLLLI